MLEIRAVRENEKDEWLPLWQAYLRFYRTELSDDITDLTWRRFNDPAEPMHLLASFKDGVMTGFAAYLIHRSTWSRDGYCYLEDLFVDAQERGRGVARALIDAVAAAARRASCGRLYWRTEEDNTTARALYDRLARKTEYVEYQMAL